MGRKSVLGKFASGAPRQERPRCAKNTVTMGVEKQLDLSYYHHHSEEELRA